MNCNGIEELCTQEANISRRVKLILRPAAQDDCFARCQNPNLDPKLLFGQKVQEANFGADFGSQIPKTAFFASASPWPNKPDYSCRIELGDDGDTDNFEDDGLDVDEDGDHLHAHFVSVQFCTQFI